MKCPNVDVALTMSDREGIEIDYCPQCRGVWLDRGELDKIIERTAATAAPAPAAPSSAPKRKDWDDDDDDYKYKTQPYPYKKKKMSSMLGEIFDF